MQDAAEQKPLDRDIDRDIDGLPLYTENIISHIKDKLERCRTDRQPLELQWALNSNFLAGNQFCDINTNRHAIEQYEAMYDWQEHNSYNKVSPLYDTRMALLSTIDYTMTVRPRTNEIDDYQKAIVSTDILRFTQQTTDFNAKRIQALSWSELTGSAFWVSWWDTDGGEEISHMQESGDMARSIREGTLKYGLLTPYEVFPESLYKQNVEDQRYIIAVQVLTADDVYDVFGVSVKGGTVSTYQLAPVVGGGGLGYETVSNTLIQKEVDDAVEVITYYERPSRLYREGRMAIVIENTVVYYDRLPYSRIPIVAQKCKDIPGLFFGKSFIEGLIPLQRAYNGVVNKINDYIKTYAANTMLVQEGSIDVDEFLLNGVEPGGVVTYRNTGNPPKPMEYPEIPSAIIMQARQYVSDMEYSAGVSQLSVTGNTPAGVDSGKAIENLKKIDNTRISLTGENSRNAVKKLAILWLEIYKKFAKGYRVAFITGSNDVGSALTWCSEDINSYDIDYDAENALILSEDAQKENFIAAFKMGLFTDDKGQIDRRIKTKALEMLKVGNYSDLLGEDGLQKQNAQRENSYFEQGVIPKVDSDFDDHEIHIEEHRKFVLQMRFYVFRRRNPEFAQLFINHIKEHENAIKEAELQATQKILMLKQMQEAQANGQRE